MEYSQPTKSPVPKVLAVGAAGAVVAAVVTILAAFGVIIPEGLSQQADATVGAVIVLISFVQAAIQFAAGYFKKDEK